MSEPVFLATNVSKQYPPPRKTLRQRTQQRGWALRDVDVAVEAGRVVAVIGRNGAGKSTLMKIAAGVTMPTLGHVVRPARIAPLIEVGAGFHPELTGRENIGVNARLMGLTAAEVRASTAAIIEFAGLGNDIDRPVREYSSGMFMRLGFSVAIHTDPALLIVDEVLAVGDLPFQSRCLARIRELRANGAGVLLVSHNLSAVLNVADTAILLDGGEVKAGGEVRHVVGAYHALLAGEANAAESTPGPLELETIEMVDADGSTPSLWDPGQEVSLEMTFRASESVGQVRMGFKVHHESAGVVSAWSNREGDPLPGFSPGERRRLRLRLRLWLGEGAHWVEMTVATADLTRFLFTSPDAYRFGMGSRPGGTGLVDLDPRIDVVDAR